MKIYTPEHPFLIRLNIRKAGLKTEYITFVDTNTEELKKQLKLILEPHLINPFAGGKKTAIDLRESLNSINGKSESFSFVGLNPEEVKKIILEYFNNE